MPIAVRCPKGHDFHVPDYLAGGHVRCPRCFRPAVVPGSAAEDHAHVTPAHLAPPGGGSGADRYRRRARWLAAAWAVLALGQCWPVVGQPDAAAGPAWAKVVVVAAMLQLALAAALANVPDWSSLWAALLALAAVATIYALAWAMALFVAPHAALWLELDQVRLAARLWCGGVALSSLALSYACGRTAARWHRDEILR